MSKVYVFANGEKYISINGKCYIKTGGTGKSDTDSSTVTIHKTLQECTGAKAASSSSGGSTNSSSSSTGSATNNTPTPVVTPPGAIDLTSTFYTVNMNDVSSAEQQALIEAQEEALAANLATVNSNNYSMTSVIEPGSIKIRTTISPERFAFAEVKRLTHEATSRTVADVSGFLYKMATKLAYKLRLLAATEPLIREFTDNIQAPVIVEEEPIPTGATDADYETWTSQNNQQATVQEITFNIPLSAEPKAFSKYLSHDDRCWRLTKNITFDTNYDIHTGELWDSADCELTRPEFGGSVEGANWELTLYYGIASRGYYVAEWYSPTSMSRGAGFNRQICVPRDRPIGIRYDSQYKLKIARISADPSGEISNNMSAEQYRTTMIDTGQVTMTEIPLQVYPAKDEPTITGTNWNNELIIFGGNYELSNNYPVDEWYIYYNEQHPEMIGWLRVIDNSSDCKSTA